MTAHQWFAAAAVIEPGVPPEYRRNWWLCVKCGQTRAAYYRVTQQEFTDAHAHEVCTGSPF